MLFQTALIGITKYIKRQNHKIKSQTGFSHEQVLSLFVKYNSTSPLHNSAYIYHRRFTPKGRGFEPHRRHYVVVLEQDTFILA